MGDHHFSYITKKCKRQKTYRILSPALKKEKMHRHKSGLLLLLYGVMNLN
jgi:transposase-like protein